MKYTEYDPDGKVTLQTESERVAAAAFKAQLDPLTPEERQRVLAQVNERIGRSYSQGRIVGQIDGLADNLRRTTGQKPVDMDWLGRQRAAAAKAKAGGLDNYISEVTRKDRIAELNAQEAKLKETARKREIELAALRDVRHWLNGPLTLERPQGSAWHKLQEANAKGAVYTLKTDGDALGNATIEGTNDLNIFVIEHDWARAFENAKDFAEGEVKLPFGMCCFEFQLSGRRICVLASEREHHNAVLFVNASNGYWIALGPPHTDDGLAGLVNAQIRAVLIAMDAEIATHEVIRTPNNVNRDRVHKGQQPLRPYHVVSLARRERAVPLGAGNGEPQRKVRLHFRRGHWRHYPEKGSKTWIKWMLVGDPDLGFIEKHYKL